MPERCCLFSRLTDGLGIGAIQRKVRPSELIYPLEVAIRLLDHAYLKQQNKNTDDYRKKRQNGRHNAIKCFLLRFFFQ